MLLANALRDRPLDMFLILSLPTEAFRKIEAFLIAMTGVISSFSPSGSRWPIRFGTKPSAALLRSQTSSPTRTCYTLHLASSAQQSCRTISIRS